MALRNNHLDPLDSDVRGRAERGHSALQTKPVQLALRYERDALRRYNAAIRVLHASARAQTEAFAAELEAAFGMPVDEAPRIVASEPEPAPEPEPEPPPVIRVEPVEDAPPRDYQAILANLSATEPTSYEDNMARLALVQECLAEIRVARDADPVPSEEEFADIRAETTPAPGPRPNRHQRCAAEARSRQDG